MDNGGSWTLTGVTNYDVGTLAINVNGHIFAGANQGGVFRSTNNGGSWTQVNTGITGNLQVFALAINASGHIFAGTSGVFRSTDNGNSWTLTGLTNAFIYALAINSSGHIFAGIAGISDGGVFRSTDNGDGWTAVNTGLTNTGVRSLAINVNGHIFAGTDGDGVFRSTDNGDSWTVVNIGLTNLAVQDLAINSNGHIFAGTDGGGVFRSMNNGDSWTAVNTGLTNLYVGSFAINSSGYIFAGTGGSGVFRSVQSTLLVTTNAATNVTPTAATLNGTVNPSGLSTAVTFQYGTTTSYGNTVIATPSPVTGASPVSVSAALAGLIPGTEYHFRVVVTNSAGTTFSADQTFTTAALPPAVTTNTATNITSSSATLNAKVNSNGLSTTVKFQYGRTTSYGSEVTATPSPVTGIDTVAVSATLTGLSPNTLYHFRAVSTNSVGTTNGDDQTFTALLSYPSSFNLSTTVSFPSLPNASSYKATDYRIVGLPGKSDLPVNQFLSGTQNKDWQVYWDNGAANNFFAAFNGSSTFQFSAGRAFWIINKGPVNINITVPSAPLNAAQEVAIPLQSGWNLITNPFTSAIGWSKIQAADTLSEPIYSFNGSFSESSTFDPYVGYYFFNATNRSSLKIPYSLLFSTVAATKVDPAIWRVNISLSSGEFSDKSTSFGIASSANSGLDRLDFCKPRTIAATPTVEFKRPEWDASYSTFATDIRPEFEESESWEFDVRTTQREASQLAFSGIT